MSDGGLEFEVNEDVPHLGGSINIGDPATYCPSVWDYTISRFGIGSVLDLGSGCGNASLYFHKKGLKTIAIDGLSKSIEKSLYPTIEHDITRSAVHTRVDLVHCQEVVEHIEEKYLGNLLNSLLSGKIILMTHAVPGQEGYHHVNLQTSDYWIRQLNSVGCAILVEDSNRIRKLAERDGAIFMANTGLVFVNNSRS
jgi:hypothetical protein